jgi:hypothetical protein
MGEGWNLIDVESNADPLLHFRPTISQSPETQRGSVYSFRSIVSDPVIVFSLRRYALVEFHSGGPGFCHHVARPISAAALIAIQLYCANAPASPRLRAREN